MSQSRSSVVWNKEASKILQDNKIGNISGFLNYLVVRWGSHLTKEGRVIVEKVCEDLDIYLIYQKTKEQLKV